jgi:hypothetical protein
MIYVECGSAVQVKVGVLGANLEANSGLGSGPRKRRLQLFLPGKYHYTYCKIHLTLYNALSSIRTPKYK